MFLRRLSLDHYGIFKDATFDLTTDVDHPLVLVSGNNGAGKTSLLEALRVALHGRRAFDVPIGEAEYLRTMTTRFHLGDRSNACAVALEFDYVDLHRTRKVTVERSWALRRQHVAETLRVTLDGDLMMVDDADDLLASIVPPEIARYFFFDGERIRELADWEVEDESALFSAVADLLGLRVLDQLRADLIRLASMEGKDRRDSRDVTVILERAESDALGATTALRTLKAQTRKVRGALDRARAEVRRVGALQQDEIAALESELGGLTAERASLIDEGQRAAGDIMPLLCARTLRKRFSKEIEARRRIEDRAIVAAFLSEHEPAIAAKLSKAGLRGNKKKETTTAIVQLAHDGLVPVSDASLPNLSRANAAWMQRVIERELPEMESRLRVTIERLRFIDDRIAVLATRRRDAPAGDPAGEAALLQLEERQRAFVEHEALVQKAEEDLAKATAVLDGARDAVKAQRLEEFRKGRLRVRERVTAQILEALPTLSQRLHTSKEERFARYLKDALRELWHKTDRLIDVSVSFAERRIALIEAFGEIRKHDLSAGEKQLFAIAFIYALAKLSGRLMPFVIDTPLGRLDQQHRRRFIAEFLPNASHQVILLSTDTEIVGPLYEDVRPLLARHHELAKFNGGLTQPVQVAYA